MVDWSLVGWWRLWGGGRGVAVLGWWAAFRVRVEGFGGLGCNKINLD